MQDKRDNGSSNNNNNSTKIDNQEGSTINSKFSSYSTSKDTDDDISHNLTLSDTANRKRPRIDTPRTPMTVDSKQATDAATASIELSPHTLRLLKLVEEGTAEHAQLAAQHLSEITATAHSSSPVILWDIIGRLQGYLTSPDWQTRQNASMAMEGVARHLPSAHQRDFLEHTAAAHRDHSKEQKSQVNEASQKLLPTEQRKKQKEERQIMWLSMEDIMEHINAILQKGRPLLSASESKFDQQEKELLEHIDRESHGDADFVKQRIKLQRQILAQRLGLSGILDYAVAVKNCRNSTSAEVEMELSVEDLNPACQYQSQSVIDKGHPTLASKEDDKSQLSLRALLVLEVTRQSNSNVASYATDNVSHRAVSYTNAQRLLATELVFQMFDASWYIRHGSLMGIMALLRAWNVHEADHFGIWPHDILARCLCLVSLDHFADYSETSSGANSGGIVAPVREMASQVSSVLFWAASEKIQQNLFEVVEHLSQIHDTEEGFNDSQWEVRYSSLLILKYIFALRGGSANISATTNTTSNWRTQMIRQGYAIGISGLQDVSSDVAGMAAQLLAILVGIEDTGCSIYDLNTSVISLVKYLFAALSPNVLISSSIKNFVNLLSTLSQMDFDLLLKAIATISPEYHPLSFLLHKLQMLYQCPYTAVKILILKLAGAVAIKVEKTLQNNETDLNENDRESVVDTLFVLIWDVRRELCGNSAGLFEDVKSTTDYESLGGNDIKEAWISLVTSAPRLLSLSPKKMAALRLQVISDYFEFDASSIEEANFFEISFGQLRKSRLSAASTIAVIVPELFAMDDCVGHSVLALSLFLSLKSPFACQCERGVLLLRQLMRRSPSIVLGRGFEDVIAMCLKTVNTDRPSCTIVDKISMRQQISIVHSSMETPLSIIRNLSSSRINPADAKRQAEKYCLTLVQKFQHDDLSRVSLDTIRLSSDFVGCLIEAGVEFFPARLTPVVRTLMTSVNNEVDENYRNATIGYMSRLLEILFDASVTMENSFRKTRNKILGNLCKIVSSSNTEADPFVASQIIGRVSNIVNALHQDCPLWQNIAPIFAKRSAAGASISSLMVLDAVCCHLSNTMSVNLLIDNFACALVDLHCTEKNVDLINLSLKCLKHLVRANQRTTIMIAVPEAVEICRKRVGLSQFRACKLLIVFSNGSIADICPFVRSLLPLAMQLMTASDALTAKPAAQLFARLVQLAPLVTESVPLRLMSDEFDGSSDKVIDHLIHGESLPPCNLPPMVNEALEAANVSLRPYQHEGIAWLHFLQTVNLNGALTDDMGLGKTLQALVGVALAHVKSKDKKQIQSLIVCPSSLVHHWEKEVIKFFPGGRVLKPYCFHEHRTKKDIPKDRNLIVVSYGGLRSSISLLKGIDWMYCVLDEGHLLKNPKTATAKAARQLNANHKLILTGTPVQNKVHEVWATFDFLMPHFLGSMADFSREFATVISKGQAIGAKAIDIATSMEKLKLLHQQVLPFILRREKSLVLKDLPPKIITIIPCEMKPAQKHLYASFCASNEGQDTVMAFSNVLKETSLDIAVQSLGASVLKALLYLRLLCTHPSLVASKTVVMDQLNIVKDSGKCAALKDILVECGFRNHDLAAADNDTSLMYIGTEDNAEGSDDFQKVLNHDVGQGTSCIPQQSVSGGSKCLIFAQFTHSLDIVAKVLQCHFPWTKFLRLDGGIAPGKRGAVVDAFNTDPKVEVLLLTTRIGGLGLSLTAADTVIFMEHDWNPHADIQAMDRAHRIGQQRTVNVYKLITKDSIEETIMKLHEKKLSMSKAIVNSENSTLYSMGTDQLLDIFKWRSTKSDRSTQNISDTLNTLVERYESEYKTFSINDFLKSFESPTE